MTAANLWVCTACGKSGPSRDKVGDVSCFLHSVQVNPATVVRDENGRVVSADVMPEAVQS